MDNHNVSAKKVLISIVKSIDLYNYLLKNHHRRTAILAYQIGNAYRMSKGDLSELILASSLHDIGALNIIERDQLLKTDVENPQPHEVLGAKMLEGFEPFENIRKIVLHHHIHFEDVANGKIPAEEVPFACYVLHLADRIEILSGGKNMAGDHDSIKEQINERFGTVFHPDLKETFNNLINKEIFWHNIELESSAELLYISLDNKTYDINFQDTENLARIFSRIVDYKSHWTKTHSMTVASIAYRLGQLSGLSKEQCEELKLAGYLHDIGKIATPSEILEKPGAFTEDEYKTIKDHAYYTSLILREIDGLQEIAYWASSHHEKHENSGYPMQISGTDFLLPIDVLAFADIFTALAEERPYRENKSKEEIMEILKTFIPDKLDANIYKVLIEYFDELYTLKEKIQNSD